MDSNYIFYILIATLVSFATTALCMPALLKLCKRRGMYDIPNERKVHHGNIPRLGGVLFMPSMLLGASAAAILMMATNHDVFANSFSLTSLLIVIGMFMIYLIGLFDDMFGMRANLKFIIQTIVALFLPFCGLYIHNLYGFCGIYEIPMWLGYAFTIFISLVIVNAINLIDGIDGLASSLALIAMLAFGFLFLTHGLYFYALYCFALSGSVFAFWFFNMFGKTNNCTKTFMGDTGSLTLGYALAFVAIRYIMIGGTMTFVNDSTALIIPFTLLLVPCFDSARVAIMRLARGRHIFHPDKTHIHHKCLRAGFSMHTSLVIIVLLQLFFCLTNWLIVHFSGGINMIVVIDVLLYVVFNLWLNYGIVKNNNPRL